MIFYCPSYLSSCFLTNNNVYLFSETCRCAEHLSVSVVQSPLESSGFNSLTSIIRNLVTTTCGSCDEYSDTKLISNSSDKEEYISFPVIKTQAFGDTDYSKFIPVISVPGIVVIEKKKTDKGLLTQVMANSIFESWPIFVFTLVTALLAGIIIWILVSCCKHNYFHSQ